MITEKYFKETTIIKYCEKIMEGLILEEYTEDDGGKLYLGKFTPKMESFLITEFGFKYHFNE